MTITSTKLVDDNFKIMVNANGVGNEEDQKIVDVEAVKRSVRNLINLNHYEKPFHPEIGSNLRGMLFENITPQMSHAIQKEISLLLQNFEPRAKLVQVATMPQFERNAYAVTISFFVQNSPDRIVVESFLERIR